MRRDAVMHAIRNSPSPLPNEALWEMGRELTRKLRAATDPFAPNVEEITRAIDALPSPEPGPAETLGRLADSLPTSAEDERVVDELMAGRKVETRSLRSACAHPRKGDELSASVRWWCPDCGAIAFWGSEPTLPALAKSMSAGSEVAPTREDVVVGNDRLSTSEPAGTIREPTIELRCGACGNSCRAERRGYDHPEATVCVTNECSRCHAATGGYGSSAYYDASGAEISGERMAAFLAAPVAQSDRGGPSDEELRNIYEDARLSLPARRRALYEAGRASRDGELKAARSHLARLESEITQSKQARDSAESARQSACTQRDCSEREASAESERADELEAALRMCVPELEKWVHAEQSDPLAAPGPTALAIEAARKALEGTK
jgi:hypothetical protein